MSAECQGVGNENERRIMNLSNEYTQSYLTYPVECLNCCKVFTPLTEEKKEALYALHPPPYQVNNFCSRLCMNIWVANDIEDNPLGHS